MTIDWNGKRAVVSGGSAGLGRHLSLTLASHGAELVLIGRNRSRLEAVRAEALTAGAPQVDLFAFDAASEWRKRDGLSTASIHDSECDRFVQYLDTHALDLLINAVGRSDRGLLGQMASSEVVDLFRVNVLSTLQMTQACWSSLQRSTGCVVNIASLAGLVAGPGLGAYSMAKHALVAMHRQWRLEAADSGIHFLLVCPGPIERDEQEDRYSDLVQSRGLSADQAKPGGGVKLRRLSPQELSVQILESVRKKNSELVVPSKVRWLSALMPVWPQWADQIVRKKF